jgi:aarF domain-containing kinase
MRERQWLTRIAWQDDLNTLNRAIRRDGLSFGIIVSFFRCFAAYAYWNLGLGVVEKGLDIRARLVKMNLYMNGLIKGGFERAQAEMAGLSVQV